ncbi:FHA domain-containing protein [Thalassoglobus sp. JC818]|uniref:FHA domain-containing protein n=1 Tax=Thalassoglobus sp. JC818 TaxID=3232136 RepID=UPI003458A20D
MLQFATASPMPLRLLVKRPNSPLEEVDVAKPFVIIGRHAECDIVIPHESVSARHVYLQAIGNRIAAVDLFSRSGVDWGTEKFHGWLSKDHLVGILENKIRLKDDIWETGNDLKPPLSFRPRDEFREEYGVLPKVDLELLNTSAKGQKWPINRVMTLVGQDERCRITIVDKNVSRVHCSLVLLPSGLWVIDLSFKRGFLVNGQQCRCSLLADGSELQIGPYLLTPRYSIPPQEHQGAVQGTNESDADFLTRQNKIFKTERVGDTMIVVPIGDSQTYFYQDIHTEASRVKDAINRQGTKNVVIDFSQVEAIGHIMVESLVQFCRMGAASGKSALCGCNVSTYEMLKTTRMLQIWDHYQTRSDALQVVSMP